MIYNPKIGGNQKFMSFVYIDVALCLWLLSFLHTCRICPGVLIFEGSIDCLAMSYQLDRELLLLSLLVMVLVVASSRGTHRVSLVQGEVYNMLCLPNLERSSVLPQQYVDK